MIEKKYFWLILVLLSGLLLTIFVISWPTLLTEVATLQKKLHVLLTEHISQVEHSPWQYGSGLILVSFLYGVFHAVGPGHGKAIIISYLGTQSHEQMSQGIKLSFWAALLQAVVAIALVTVIAQILDLSMGTVRKYSHNLEMVSYVVIILLGGGICLRALWGFHKLRLSKHEQAIHSDVNKIEHSYRRTESETLNTCGCQHHYVPETGYDGRQRWLVVLSMGLRPCTGAVIVLMYAYVVNSYIFGVLATLAMGVGTGLAIALLAVVTVLCRVRLLESMAYQDGKRYVLFQFFGIGLMLAGGVLLLLLGVSLLMMTDAAPINHPLL